MRFKKFLREILSKPLPCVTFFLLFNALMMEVGTFNLVLSNPFDKFLYVLVIALGLVCSAIIIGMTAFYHL